MPLQPFSDQSAFAVTEAPGSAFADSERHLIPKEHKQKATTIQEVKNMKHVKTLNNKTLKESMKKGGCGECQTSCQSACTTSCTVGNQSCENANR